MLRVVRLPNLVVPRDVSLFRGVDNLVSSGVLYYLPFPISGTPGLKMCTPFDFFRQYVINSKSTGHSSYAYQIV